MLGRGALDPHSTSVLTSGLYMKAEVYLCQYKKNEKTRTINCAPTIIEDQQAEPKIRKMNGENKLKSCYFQRGVLFRLEIRSF